VITRAVSATTCNGAASSATDTTGTPATIQPTVGTDSQKPAHRPSATGAGQPIAHTTSATTDAHAAIVTEVRLSLDPPIGVG
jgi:hypothetical protein